MKIFIEKQAKNIEEIFSGSAGELVKKLGLNPEAVLIVRNNSLITEDEILEDRDEIKLLSVISGG